MSRSFPAQSIPILKKNKQWYAQHLDYAQDLLISYNGLRGKMTRLYEAYNGVKLPGSISWLERNYGKQNKSKYIAYRAGRAKISLLHGEWLKRPLSATVETTNLEARTAKMQQLDFMTGAMIAKKELTDLKEKAGVDVMEGMQIPDNEDDPIWAQMSPKDKEEDIMQIIIDEQIKELDLRKKIGDCFLDLLITAMCYFIIELDEEGEIRCRRIDPRDAIYEHIEGDDYLEKSPIKGHRETLPVHEILKRYNLTKEQRLLLETCQRDPDNHKSNWMRMTNGELLCDVLHIEWDSFDPEYSKLSPKTKSQLELDPTNPVYTMELDPEKYEKDIDAHNKNVEKGAYKIETRWAGYKYEATRIGGLMELDVNCRKKPFQPKDEDSPMYPLDVGYHGFIFGTIDGTRVSLQQMIENFDNLFDINMYQILKELARAKGKVLTYDRAGLPQKRKLQDVMYQALNDQFLDYDSSAAGNVSGRTLDPSNMFKEFDLGFSESFEQLINFKNDILNTMNQITGINENREGQIAASSTATNANSAIQASRTITEPLFFGMNGFVKKLMMSVINSTKISWGLYKVEKGENILGAGKFKFMQVTKAIAYKSYDAHIEDGGEYLQLRQEMNSLMEFSLNAKEIRPMDVLKVKLAKTTIEMKTTLENSWLEMQKNMAEQQQRDQMAQQQMQQQQLQMQQQMQDKAVQDQGGLKGQEIQQKTQGQMMIDDNKTKNKLFEQQHVAENDILTAENGNNLL